MHFVTQPEREHGDSVCAEVGRTVFGCNQGLRVSTSVLCTSKARSVNAGSREAEELTDWQCCQSVR